MRKYIKKAISVFLVVTMVFTIMPSVFAASKKDDVFTFSVHPERQEYAKGEEIKFISEIRNNGIYDIENVVVVADVPRTDTLLSRGASEVTISKVAAGSIAGADFRFSEYSAVESIGKFFTFFGRISTAMFREIVRQYNTIASLFVTTSFVLKSGISHTFAIRNTQKLDSCKVIYDGKEYEFGFHVTYEKVKKDSLSAEKTGESSNAFVLDAKIKDSKTNTVGVVFGSEFNGNDFDGYIMYINPASGKAGVVKKAGNSYTDFSSKRMSIDSKKEYDVRIVSDGQKVVGCINNEIVFDIPFQPDGNSVGKFGASTGTVVIGNVSENNEAIPEDTYTNPVMGDGADPFVLYHDGTYYMYVTNSYSWNGFEVFTSKDLYDWTYGGVVAKRDDIIGGGNFWAAEVYEYNGKFYMLYSADEHSAIAVADSPMGPFKKTSDNFLFDFNAIDGNLLFDDDGRIYMYFSRIRHGEGFGQQIWGCEMNPDLLSVKEGTLTLISDPDHGEEGWVNEGPFVIKHDGTYYLTYSTNFYFQKNYSVAYSVSSSPLGKYTRYENNPILEGNAFITGTGHHCFINNAETGELFIVYHCHNSMTEVHNRKVCIDRVKFIETEKGPDALYVCGPTVTPQVK